MKTITMKVWQQTHDNLKILAAYQGQTILSTLDRLVKEALEREEEKRKARPNGQ
jgi:hypothetical protein